MFISPQTLNIIRDEIKDIIKDIIQSETIVSDVSRYCSQCGKLIKSSERYIIIHNIDNYGNNRDITLQHKNCSVPTMKGAIEINR